VEPPPHELDYAGPATPPPQADHRPGGIPSYHGITGGATLLQRSARTYATLAILAFILAAGAVVLGIIGVVVLGNPAPIGAAVMAALFWFAAGIVLHNRAIYIRLLAELS